MKKIARTTTLLGVVALMSTVVSASDSVIIKRQNLMNNIVAPNVGILGQMIKPRGGTPFDSAKAKEALKKDIGGAGGLHQTVPPG